MSRASVIALEQPTVIVSKEWVKDRTWTIIQLRTSLGERRAASAMVWMTELKVAKMMVMVATTTAARTAMRSGGSQQIMLAT